MFVLPLAVLPFAPVNACTVEQQRAASIIDRARRRAGMDQEQLAREQGKDPSQFAKELRGIGRLDFAKLFKVEDPRFLKALAEEMTQEAGGVVLWLDQVVSAVASKLKMARADTSCGSTTSQSSACSAAARASAKEVA